jgi:hypothetical protein
MGVRCQHRPAEAHVRASNLSAREKALIAAAVFVLLATFELFFRVLPCRKELADIQERNAKILEGLAPAPTPPVDAELQKLVSRRAELKKKLEDERAATAKLENRFPKDESAALVAVSELAERTRVLVRESEPFSPGKDDLGRPRRRFVLVATFPALREFVAGLATLPPGPLHFEKFELEAIPMQLADDEAADDDPHVLLATFVLVL